MKIAIFGLGYVGITAAACLSQDGHEIIGIDTNEDKVKVVNSGNSPITEPGIADLIKSAVANKLLLATQDAESHISTCDVAIVCVGTPSAPDGSHNMGFIAEVSRQIATLVDHRRFNPLTVVYRSTIRPGTIEELVLPIFAQELEDRLESVELVYNPEFLRESVAIDDYRNPPKIVIGTKDGRPCKNLDLINANLRAPTFYTHYREAEITKFVDNTFHAVKITFANEIGRVCRQLGIDVRQVYEIFVSDTKLNISNAYLRPGGAFGGSCLPKDVRALQHISSDVGANTYLVDSLLRSNEAHKHFLFETCVNGLEPNANVLMIGMAFKGNSDDLRESPSIDLARKLLREGYLLSIYDPHVDPSKLLGQNLGYVAANLPTLRRLLVAKEEIESKRYDLVIDTLSWSKNFALKYAKLIVINNL